MPIKYDETYIKRPNEAVKYTPETILELKKCSESITNFLPYVKIIHPDKGKINFDPYPFQVQILQTVMGNRFVVILCARQAGKCVQSQSFITLRNKKTGKIEEIPIEEIFEK